jgi:hypothetical protein
MSSFVSTASSYLQGIAAAIKTKDENNERDKLVIQILTNIMDIGFV